MSTNHPNWVAERAKCHMGLLYGEFRSMVERDVQTMDTLCKEKGWGWFFAYLPTTPTRVLAEFSHLFFKRSHS